LAAAAASTTVPAGDKSSITHYRFCGVTAAVAPNRTVARWHSSESVVLVKFTHCRAATSFRVSYFSTSFSGCTL